MIILGIDPGTAITGFGLLEVRGNRFLVQDYGAITTPAKTLQEERLLTLFTELRRIIRQYNPQHLAVEQLFFNRNTNTAISVGQARGVILLAAAEAGLTVGEFTPSQVKQSVVGYGKAEKKQVQQMVKTLLNLPEIPKPDDVADALAIAICYAHSYRYNQNLRERGDSR